MIRCPKCDAENQIGAIFCRSCGERLNLDELTPEDIASQNRESGLKTAAVICGRVIKLAILLLIVLCLVGLFIPPPQGIGEYENGERRYRGTLAKLDSLRRGVPAGTTYSLSAAEINALADAQGGFADASWGVRTDREQTGKGILHSVDVHVWPRNGGYVKCVLKSKLMDKLPLYVTAIFLLEVGDEGLESNLVSAKVGRVPMPGPAAKFPLARFKTIFPDAPDLFKDVAPLIRAIKTSPEEIAIESASPSNR